MGYGFKHGTGGSTGKALGTLVVTAPVGVTATASKEDKVYTKVVGEDGTATFKGLTTGEWTVTIDNGSQTSTQYVTVTLDYALAMAFFAATISVTYPIGSTCTCSDGVTTFTATDASGSYSFIVPNAGEWTVTITDGINTVSNTVEITSDGQVENVKMAFFAATISATYPEGSTCTCSDGTTTLTAPDTSGSCTFTVRNTGSWTVSATNGEEFASKVAVITSDGQSESVILLYETYLYLAGDTCDDITGGYVVAGLRTGESTSSSSTGEPTINYNDSSMVISAAKTSSAGKYIGGIVRTASKIDCSEYSKLIFEGTVEGAEYLYNGVTICLWTEIGDYQAANCVDSVKMSNGSDSVELDITSLTESYYIGFGFSSTNAQITVTMESLRLE